MIDDLRLIPKMSTALDIAILVKAIPLEQAAALIQQYADTQSAGARGEAKQEARQEFYERTLRIQNAPIGEGQVMSEWQPISTRPEIDRQPGRQFILIEGSRYHSGVHWHRVHAGEAWIRTPGGDDEMLQYRKSDILRLCADGDMEPWSAQVTHWMPAVFPSFPERKDSNA